MSTASDALSEARNAGALRKMREDGWFEEPLHSKLIAALKHLQEHPPKLEPGWRGKRE